MLPKRQGAFEMLNLSNFFFVKMLLGLEYVVGERKTQNTSK